MSGSTTCCTIVDFYSIYYGRPSAIHRFFLGVDDQLRWLETATQTGIVVLMFDLASSRIGLRPASTTA
jgi:hypothetical protein